ncbi:MAG: hypothetical protein CMH83_22835 [Nocardioides sp.]|nr:hypothetical protein [Nocardioides sp.]
MRVARGSGWRGPYYRCSSCGAIIHTKDGTLVDRGHYEEIAGQLRGLLIRLDDRLPSKGVALIAEFIDANELGLALEQMADVLSEDEQPLNAEERADMLSLVDRMQMGDRVPRALESCPDN